MDTISLILWIILGILGLVIIGFSAFIIVLNEKYRNRAIIKKPGNKSLSVRYDKFMIAKDIDGTPYYRFRKYRKLYGRIPPMPDECLEIDERGRFFGVWYDVDGSLVPGKDGFDKVDKEELVASTKPFNANQRSIMINQFKKAERQKKKSLTDVLMASLPMAAVITLIAVILIFLPDVVIEKGAVKNAELQAQNDALDKLIIITNNLDRIANDRVIIGSEDTINNNSIPVNNMVVPN